MNCNRICAMFAMAGAIVSVNTAWSAPGGAMDVVDGANGQWFAGTGYSSVDDYLTYEYIGVWCAFQWNESSSGPDSFFCGTNYLPVTATPAAISIESYSIYGQMDLTYVEGWSTHYADWHMNESPNADYLSDYYDCDGAC